MKKSIIAMLVAAPLMLSGCIVSVGSDEDRIVSGEFSDREYNNRKKIARIVIGSSYADATNKLGVADFNESYEKDGQNVQVLFYRTNRVHKDGLTTRDECTYLYFVDGALKETGLGGDFARNTGS